jgi:hypothetical protein
MSSQVPHHPNRADLPIGLGVASNEEMEERAAKAFRGAAEAAGLRISPFAEMMQARGYLIDASAARRWIRQKGKGMPAWALLAAYDVAGLGSFQLNGERSLEGEADLRRDVDALTSIVRSLEQAVGTPARTDSPERRTAQDDRLAALEKRVGELEDELGQEEARRIAQESRLEGSGP